MYLIRPCGGLFIIFTKVASCQVCLILVSRFLTNSLFSDEIFKITPIWISHLFVQCVAGTLGGFTTTLFTNPLDIVRARLQVEPLFELLKDVPVN